MNKLIVLELDSSFLGNNLEPLKGICSNTPKQNVEKYSSILSYRFSQRLSNWLDV